MKRILPRVLATREEFPFGRRTTGTKAFLIERPENKNIWVYASCYVKEDAAEYNDTIIYQLLNHRDEASKFCNVLDAPVFCHQLEKEAIERNGAVVGETYDEKEYEIASDLIAYHTPGHTPCATSYLWRMDVDKTAIFTGDTLYPSGNGMLEYGPLSYHSYDGNREDMIATLRLFLRLNPTYVIPGLSCSGEFLIPFKPNEVQLLIDELESPKVSL